MRSDSESATAVLLTTSDESSAMKTAMNLVPALRYQGISSHGSCPERS